MKPKRSGFTLVELLVVIAIIGVLVAMTIPAMQASREASRRTFCQHNAGRLLLALQSYEDAYESLPPGVVNPDGPIRSEASGIDRGWLVELLPYLDEQNAYMLVDGTKSVYDQANERVRRYWPRVFVCPSESIDIEGASNYAGCHHDVEAPINADNNGVLFLNSRIRREDISDGVAHTFFLGEKRADPHDLGWMSGTREPCATRACGPTIRRRTPCRTRLSRRWQAKRGTPCRWPCSTSAASPASIAAACTWASATAGAVHCRHDRSDSVATPGQSCRWKPGQFAGVDALTLCRFNGPYEPQFLACHAQLARRHRGRGLRQHAHRVRPRLERPVGRSRLAGDRRRRGGTGLQPDAGDLESTGLAGFAGRAVRRRIPGRGGRRQLSVDVEWPVIFVAPYVLISAVLLVAANRRRRARVHPEIFQRSEA